MDHGNDDDRIFFNSKVDSKWKPMHDGTAGASVNDGIDSRILRDYFARTESFIEKFAPQTLTLLLIPNCGLFDVGFRFWTKIDPELHNRFLTSAMTCSASRP